MTEAQTNGGANVREQRAKTERKRLVSHASRPLLVRPEGRPQPEVFLFQEGKGGTVLLAPPDVDI